MNLKDLLNQGRLRQHKTSKKEIENLLALVRRDVTDAKVEGLSSDRRFTCAYNAVLQLATVLLYCKGYEPEGLGHHFTMFQTMKIIMGTDYYTLADYFLPFFCFFSVTYLAIIDLLAFDISAIILFSFL